VRWWAAASPGRASHELSERGSEIAATVSHLRSLRNALRTFGFDPQDYHSREEKLGLSKNQFGMLTFVAGAIRDLDPYNLTEEPVGAVTDRVLDGSAD